MLLAPLPIDTNDLSNQSVRPLFRVCPNVIVRTPLDDGCVGRSHRELLGGPKIPQDIRCIDFEHER